MDGPRRAGMELLYDPASNKGTAFTSEERDALGLRGLLPPRVFTLAEQVSRVLVNLERKPNALEKYIFLSSLQNRNETLFHRVLQDHLEQLMPIVYTPTVGQACQNYGEIFRRPRGLFITIEDLGRVKETMANWPGRQVKVIVVTDGERILGLGDLGANGMGIPVGKLALYTACAGVRPQWCLPVTLDVGTDNDALREDPLYVGLPRRRERGEAYDRLVEEFVQASQALFPGALVQFEDFGNRNAFRLLQRYRERICTFDDDIQGTAAVTLAGLLASGRLTGRRLTEERLLLFGAGEAGIGIGELVVSAMIEQGASPQDARARCVFVDSKGLVVSGRADLDAHKRRFAQNRPPLRDPQEIVAAVRPTALIGASGQGGLFTRPVLEALAQATARPLVFALSNPTSKSECTAEEALRWTDGRAIFASGSPFPPLQWRGRTVHPGQANNAYVFPGVGLGALAVGARRVTDEMFLVAAKTLAGLVSEADLGQLRLFPALKEVRTISHAIAVAVAEVAYARGLACLPRPADLGVQLRALMYEPHYPGEAGAGRGP
jgi:malate dehydrogenase (oxaloacetate-decarboxylating)(NADP+)